jgi:Protein of unknown function (DUF4199)
MAILDNPQEDSNVGNISFMPTAQKWGLYLTAASIIFTILMSIVGFKFDSMMSLIIFSLVIGLAALTMFIVFGRGAIREHRAELGGFIDFKQAFLVCFVAFLISVIISTPFNFVYNNYINPSFMDGMKESMMSMFDEANVPEASRADALKGIEDGKTIAGTLKQMLSSSIFAAVMAAIMAAIMKKARPMFG